MNNLYLYLFIFWLPNLILVAIGLLTYSTVINLYEKKEEFPVFFKRRKGANTIISVIIVLTLVLMGISFGILHSVAEGMQSSIKASTEQLENLKNLFSK
ncbi:MAG: hypothetical protein AAF975_09005 [Spirochaetota bacterium]